MSWRARHDSARRATRPRVEQAGPGFVRNGSMSISPRWVAPSDAEAFDRRVELRGGRLIAEEHALAPIDRNADAQVRQCRTRRADRPVARIRIRDVRPGHQRRRRPTHHRRSARTPRRNRPAAAGGRDASGVADHAEAWLCASHEMLPSPAGTRPEPAVSSCRAKTGTNSGRRPRHPEAGARYRRAHEFFVEHVARHAVGERADQPRRELVEIGLADRDRAGGAQARRTAVGDRPWPCRRSPGMRLSSGIPGRIECCARHGERHAAERRRSVLQRAGFERVRRAFIAQRDEDRR